MNKTIDEFIKSALKEDIPTVDVSSEYLFTDEVSEGTFTAKEDCVISGIDIAKRVFEIVDPSVLFKIINHNGTFVETGTIIAIVQGKTKSILQAERLALNIMQRMSGIATMTRLFVNETRGTNTVILDTRKTTPNLRLFEKRAVLDGGGINHRMSLSDQVMLKDNHINAASSITNAVEIVRKKVGPDMKIEVEVETFEQYVEACNTSCYIIMLDNMSTDLMSKCIAYNHDKFLEASGNMTLDRIKEVASTGVDSISVGALTHSYKSADISLKFMKRG